MQWKTPGLSLLSIKKEIWSLLQDGNVCGFAIPAMSQRDSCCLLTDTNTLSLSLTHTPRVTDTKRICRGLETTFLSTVNNSKYFIFMELSNYSSCHLLLLVQCFEYTGGIQKGRFPPYLQEALYATDHLIFRPFPSLYLYHTNPLSTMFVGKKQRPLEVREIFVLLSS